ncbi:hypothetical protein BJ165DRAFT_1397607 [Panaeolus papilionaceus]|nr:hypothetical protein BJ165DRAFT_1397607 [Panaeolus papilionaceus]
MSVDVMQNVAGNPDGRPLPEGWSQHFEPSKRMWYYVQMNIMPPKVSFTHPADLAGNGEGSRTPTLPQSSHNTHHNSMPRPQSMSFPQMPGVDGSRSGGLTFAQKLYASSASNTHAVPMLNPTDIHQNAGKPHLPSPPPSSRGTSPLPISPADFHPAAIPRPNASRMSSMPNFGVSAMLPVPSSTSGGATPSTHHHHPVRSTTFAAAQAFGQPNRVVTHHAKPGFPPPRQTPHIITTARPPTESSTSTAHPALNPAGGPPKPPPLNNTAGSAAPGLGGNSSPPPTSVLFSKPQPPPPPPPPPPPMLSTQQPPYGSMSPPNQINSPTSTISTITPDNAHLHRPSATTIQNNMISMAYNPVEPSPLGGGGPTFDSRLIPSLRFALSRAGTRVSEADIQCVIQGQMDANYQGVVNALKQQQLGWQLQSEGDQIDYAALVVETQRLQIRAQAQQAENLLAQQSNLQAQAYAQLSASLQAQQEAQAQALAERLQQEEMARLQAQQQMAAIQQQAQQALEAQQQQILAQQQQALAAQQQQNQQLLAQQQQQGQTLAQQQQQQALAQQQQQQQAIAQQQQALVQQQQQLAAQAQQQQQQLAAQQQAQLQQQAAAQEQLAQQQQAMYSSMLQQQQQQQPQQHHGSTLNTFLDIYNQFQQQPTTTTDPTNQAPPSFDALYGSAGGADPTAGASSFMDSLNQTINSSATGLLSGGGGGDPSGGISGFLSGLNTSLGNTDGSAFGSAFDMGSLGDSLGAFASD